VAQYSLFVLKVLLNSKQTNFISFLTQSHQAFLGLTPVLFSSTWR